MKHPRDPRRAGLPDGWLAHARSDLQVAVLLKDEEGVLPEQVCFHAQQAAEMALKGVLLHCGSEFRLTHDIQQLPDTVERSELAIPPEIEEAGVLMVYAVQSRYPGGWEMIPPDEVEEAIELATQVVDWAQQIIETSDESP